MVLASTSARKRLSGLRARCGRSEIEQGLGIDLGEDLYAAYENKPVVVADPVEPLAEDETYWEGD